MPQIAVPCLFSTSLLTKHCLQAIITMNLSVRKQPTKIVARRKAEYVPDSPKSETPYDREYRNFPCKDCWSSLPIPICATILPRLASVELTKTPPCTPRDQPILVDVPSAPVADRTTSGVVPSSACKQLFL